MPKKKAPPSPNRKGLRVEVWVAIIGLLGILIPALLNFPPFVKLFEPKPTLTFISTIEPTGITTSTHTPIITNTSTAEPTSTETHTPMPTETFTLVAPTETATTVLTPTSSLPLGMQVILDANITSGKAPLLVKFDARRSYFRDSTGTVFPCGACNYTWQIRQASKTIYGPEKGQGTFEFRFEARGTYFVTVVVCRSNSSDDCNGGGSSITVK